MRNDPVCPLLAAEVSLEPPHRRVLPGNLIPNYGWNVRNKEGTFKWVRQSLRYSEREAVAGVQADEWNW